MDDGPADLRPYEVRRNYAGQILRYAWPLARWRLRLAAYRRRPAEWHRRRLPALVRRLLREAQERTPFYAESFRGAAVQWSDLRALEDLRWFPILSRRDLQERFDDLLSAALTPALRREGTVWRTSGSTGQPAPFFLNGESTRFPLALYRFLGAGPGRPFSGGVAFLCTLPRSLVYRAWLPLFGGTTFRKLHFAEAGADRDLTRLNPRVVTGDPHSLARLVQGLARGAIRIRPRLVLSSAFDLPEERARALERLTGARVVDCYSIAETGPLACRCAPGRPFHVLGPACHLETDPSGEILVTNLRNPLFPIVRYRTGDLGEIAWEPCACGYRGPSVLRLLGRTAARFVDARGRTADPSQVEPVLARLPVRQYQLSQEAPDRVTLRYHGPEEIADPADLREALGRLLGGPVALELRRSAAPLWGPGEKPLPYSR